MGGGHGGGVEDGAGKVVGFGASEDVGDEGTEEALAAEAGVDKGALDIAGVRSVLVVRGNGAVGDGGGGLVVHDGDQNFSSMAGVGDWQGCDLVVEPGEVASATSGGYEEVIVVAEEVTSGLGKRRGFIGDGFDAEHGGIIYDVWRV